jgi:hypothetical protein
MRCFDQIFEKALGNLREGMLGNNNSSLPNPNTMISAFQALPADQQQKILSVLPKKGTNLSNDDDDHGHFSKWIELMHNNQTPEDKSPTTVANNPQTTNPSSVSGNGGVSSSTSGNTSSGGFV